MKTPAEWETWSDEFWQREKRTPWWHELVSAIQEDAMAGNGKGKRTICVSDEAYAKLALLAEEEERKTCRFVAIQAVASRLILANAETEACTSAGRVCLMSGQESIGETD